MGYFARGRGELLSYTEPTKLNNAIQLFHRAIALDSLYATAYAGLGESYATLHYDYDTKEIWVDKAIESSLKALMYDSTVAEAYAALAMAYFSKKSIQEAEAAARKAIDLGVHIVRGIAAGSLLAAAFADAHRAHVQVQVVVEDDGVGEVAAGPLHRLRHRLHRQAVEGLVCAVRGLGPASGVGVLVEHPRHALLGEYAEVLDVRDDGHGA